jgi:SAM-dependent methyltransferase
MRTNPPRVSDHYNALYLKADCFGQTGPRYRRFIAALVAKSGLEAGAKVLDVGCGQGYLSQYLAECGLNVWCSDISEAGLRSLDRCPALFRHKRILANLLRPPFYDVFDFVFQRSCSLLNGPAAPSHIDVVERLIDCAKVGGTICVVYNSNLSGRRGVWFDHTLTSFRSAFATVRLTDVRFYVLNKIDCIALGRHSFNSIVTLVNVGLSKFTHRSFEIVVLAKRCA